MGVTKLVFALSYFKTKCPPYLNIIGNDTYATFVIRLQLSLSVFTGEMDCIMHSAHI